ncbi:MAG TPA: 2Fe-2S iron-sulfur cluster-binding protein [Acidimicrobiales bacterium]|nr:2Fe-2S iron-sulfur cluster-binding protein [Acidimicrobiales bacterium]
MAGRAVTTVDGLDPSVRERFAAAFTETGASQCGFCTPGIIMRLAGLEQRGPLSGPAVSSALLAHLCRCTGWRTILEAADRVGSSGSAAATSPRPRDLEAAARRAAIEGRTPQAVGPMVALGGGGFSDDTAPPDALVAVPDPAGGWAVAETLSAARAAAGKVQGRHSTLEVGWPLDVPEGDWDLALATTWVEPGYLETDVSWCAPGGEPATPLANGGAFGGKVASVAPAAARMLADRHGRPVRVLLSREDAVRLGPKRPPLAAGVRADGTGTVRVLRTPGIAAAIASVAPGLAVEEVEVPGPPTSAAVRAAGWAEAAVLLSVLDARRRGSASVVVRAPDGAVAEAEVDDAGVRVRVGCGDPLDHVVLRSYCVGAAHMALGWVRSEAIAVDGAGVVHDLTIRSFGILRARDTPEIEVDVADGDGEPVNGSDAVFAAVAGAAWLAAGLPERWPCARGGVR